MENTYNLNGLWQASSTGSQETLSISYYQGNASLVIFAKGGGAGSKKPLVKIGLPGPAIIKLRSMLKQMLDAQPGTRKTFEQKIYDRDSKQFRLGNGLIFSTDEKRVFTLEVTNKSLQSAITFKLLAGNSFATDGNDLSDEERSKLKLLELIEILAGDYTARLLSRFNMQPYQRSGNNNYQKRSNNGGSVPKEPSSSSSYDDDEFNAF